MFSNLISLAAPTFNGKAYEERIIAYEKVKLQEMIDEEMNENMMKLAEAAERDTDSRRDTDIYYEEDDGGACSA